MVSTKTLLTGVVGLVSIDIIATLLAVGILGATELNPLSGTFGFAEFMILKIVVSFAALYVMYRYLIQSAPTAARYGLCFLLVLYGGVCASNAYQIVGASA